MNRAPLRGRGGKAPWSSFREKRIFSSLKRRGKKKRSWKGTAEYVSSRTIGTRKGMERRNDADSFVKRGICS